jgi:hypothetical protein
VAGYEMPFNLYAIYIHGRREDKKGRGEIIKDETGSARKIRANGLN